MTNSVVYVEGTNAVDNFIYDDRYMDYETLFPRYVEYLIGWLEEAFFAHSLPIERKNSLNRLAFWSDSAGSKAWPICKFWKNLFGGGDLRISQVF